MLGTRKTAQNVDKQAEKPVFSPLNVLKTGMTVPAVITALERQQRMALESSSPTYLTYFFSSILDIKKIKDNSPQKTLQIVFSYNCDLATSHTPMHYTILSMFTIAGIALFICMYVYLHIHIFFKLK